MKRRDGSKSEKRLSTKLPVARRWAPPAKTEEAPRSETAPPAIDYTRGTERLPPRVPRVPPGPAAPRSLPPSALAADDLAPKFELRSDEGTIEGARVGFARRLRELARGLLPVFETIDLHGMSIAKAESAVRSFCASARGSVPRTVLVVHGKGIHSEAGHAVLRDEVAHWLSTAPLARDVLCFVTARPKHGGSGAMYVLLAARSAPVGATKPPHSRR